MLIVFTLMMTDNDGDGMEQHDIPNEPSATGAHIIVYRRDYGLMKQVLHVKSM